MINRIMIVLFISLLLFISGCKFDNLNQTNNLSEEKTLEIVHSKGYDIRVKDVEIVYNCVGLTKKDTCSIINLEIATESDKSIKLALNRYAIVLNDGTQLGMYTGMMGLGAGIPDKCYNPHSGGMTLFPGAKQDISLCFPEVRKESFPNLYLGFLYDYKEEYDERLQQVKIIGEQRENQINITPFLKSNLDKEYKLSIVVSNGGIKIKNNGNTKEGFILNYFIRYLLSTINGFREVNVSYETTMGSLAPYSFDNIREVDANSEFEISMKECVPENMAYKYNIYNCKLTLLNADGDKELDTKIVNVYYKKDPANFGAFEILEDSAYDEFKSYLKELKELIE